MPVYSLLLVCVLSLSLHTRPRVHWASGIPHALFWARATSTTRAHRAARTQSYATVSTSLRANGSRECAPDDRLREAIHSRRAKAEWICFVASLLAMTVWLFENVDPSCPDLIWASINLHDEPFSKKMDHRVKSYRPKLVTAGIGKAAYRGGA